MNPDSVLRSINRRIEQYADTFGITSFEYQWAKNMIFVIGKMTKVPIGRKKGGKVLLSRSKTVLAEIYDDPYLEQAIADMWQKLKDRGTVKTILKDEYLNQPGTKEWMEEENISVSDIMNDPDYMEEIREESSVRAESAFDDSESPGSGEVNEEIDEIADSDLPDDMKDELLRDLGEINREFHRTGKGIREDKWDNIERMWREYKYKKERYFAMKAAETEPE